MVLKRTKKLPTALPSNVPTDVRHEREVNKGLSAIYRDETGAIPDLSNFEPLKSRWRLYAILVGGILTALLIVAAWAGFSIFKPFSGLSGPGLEISIEGPEKISLGQETTYFINYKNRTAEPITAAALRVSFPNDFIIDQVEPKPNSDGYVWNLRALAVEGRGTITIRGTFTGALGTVTALQVVGTYKTQRSNDREALATKVLDYSDSVLSGILEVPAKVLPGDKVTLKYSVLNTGLEDLDNLYIRLAPPEGFQKEGELALYPIPKLPAGASTTIAVIGSFAAGISGEAHVLFETGRLGADGSFYTAQRSETSFAVLAGDLSLKLVMNGNDQDAIIEYGAPMRFAIGYENTSPEELKDVSLSLHFEQAVVPSSTKLISAPVDWKTLSYSVSGTRKGDAITWTKDNLAVLARLSAREEGSIDVSVNSLASANAIQNLSLRAYVEAEIGSVGNTKVKRAVKSAPLVFRYITDADISAEARYYSEEGAPLGTGPLPPVVGQATSYRIFWKVSKSVHELQGMAVKAVLPKIAVWPNTFVVEAGEIAYDENTRTVSWTLNRLPEDMDDISAEFDIRIVPGENDANRFAQLLGETKFETLDANTNEKITRTDSALSTDLQNDENAQAKGVVRKE